MTGVQTCALPIYAQVIPLDELKARLAEVPTDKPVIAVCHAGTRSGQATVILRDAGIANVANMRGGMLLWREMGLPVLYRSERATK